MVIPCGARPTITRCPVRACKTRPTSRQPRRGNSTYFWFCRRETNLPRNTQVWRLGDIPFLFVDKPEPRPVARFLGPGRRFTGILNDSGLDLHGTHITKVHLPLHLYSHHLRVVLERISGNVDIFLSCLFKDFYGFLISECIRFNRNTSDAAI